MPASRRRPDIEVLPLGDHSRRHHRLRDGGCRLDTLPIDDLCATENLRRRLQGLAVQLSGLLGEPLESNEDGVATVIGSLAFVVFAVASLAQVVVGSMLDQFGPRNVYMVVAAIQIVFFAMDAGPHGRRPGRGVRLRWEPLVKS